MPKARKTPMATTFVQVLMFRDGEHWVAQGIEYNIAAQGRTQEETKRAFARTFVGRLIWDMQHDREPLAGLGPAPQRYLAMASELTQDKQLLSAPERMSAPEQADCELPPAFMIPVIQQGNHHYS
jgi:hypothetical protein